jgi:hypothetical protein
MNQAGHQLPADSLDPEESSRPPLPADSLDP